MIEKVDYESVVDAAMHLGAADRRRIAGYLWESLGAPVAEWEDEALEQELAKREAELDAAPAKEMSHGEFLAAFTKRRNSCDPAIIRR